ncbi:hypothetical protein TIFTF001_033961 [Ficus carica]|uniref:Uncharacterized protein n=1 Tax=Ficus carica TaxID=3494 RepID=A0AA88J896_FICCA|nr:hypothetical protein TIFTF001_033961 [Ficus carica]
MDSTTAFSRPFLKKPSWKIRQNTERNRVFENRRGSFLASTTVLNNRRGSRELPRQFLKNRRVAIPPSLSNSKPFFLSLSPPFLRPLHSLPLHPYPRSTIRSCCFCDGGLEYMEKQERSCLQWEVVRNKRGVRKGWERSGRLSDVRPEA